MDGPFLQWLNGCHLDEPVVDGWSLQAIITYVESWFRSDSEQ